MLKNMQYLFSAIIATLLFFFLATSQIEAAGQRIEGSGRYETAVEIAGHGWPNGAETVVLARGDLFPDALAGAPLAKKKNAPILLTTQKQLPSATKSKLIHLKTKKVYLLGGPQAIYDSVQTELKNMGITVERIYGNDRYSTSVEIAKQLEATKDEVIVATGNDFPDALAVASYAAENEAPILITKPDSLPSTVEKYVIGSKKTYIIGGIQAISENVEKKLPNSIRIAGNSRYDTAIEIITRFYKDTANLYVSTGTNFADALTGSVLAAKNNTAILLIDKEKLVGDVEYLFSRNHVESFSVFGGKAAVSDKMIDRVSTIIQSTNHDSIGAAKGSSNLLKATAAQISAFENAKKTAETNGKLSFTVHSSVASSFKSGLSYIMPTSIKLPNGFIGKVESVNTSTGKIIMAQPAIEEVFSRLSVVKDNELNVGDIKGFTLKEGVSLVLNNKKINNQSEWNKTLQGINGQALESTPLSFDLASTIVEKSNPDGSKNNIVMNGSLNIKDAQAKINTEYNTSSGLSALDLYFNSTENADLTFDANWDGKISIPKSDVFSNWSSVQTNNSNQFLLGTVSYEVGTVPLFAIDHSKLLDIPIGINVTFQANLQGEMTANASFAVIKTSENQRDVTWNQNKQYFTSSLTNHRNIFEQTFEGNAHGTFSYEYGISPSLQIGGLIPLDLHQKEMSNSSIQLEGKTTVNLLTGDLNDRNGCYNNTLKVDEKTNLIARLISLTYDSSKGNSSTTQIQHKSIYNKSINGCENIGLITGITTNAKSNATLSNVTISAYKNGSFLNSTTSSTDGSYELDLQEGTYTLLYKKAGFQTETVEQVKVLKNGRNVAQTIPLTSLADKGNGTVSGQIKDSLSGVPISNVTINLRKGYQSSEGEIVKTVETDQNGNYVISNVPSGLYSGEISLEGYIPYTFNIQSVKGATIPKQNGTLSPIMTEQQTRMVLSWSDQPNDLDLHLTGPAIGDERFHLFWDTKEYSEDGQVLAQIDGNDLRNSFGHETATINQQKSGIFRLSVFNYSYRLHDGSTALANSKAKIDVYKGNKLTHIFYIPTTSTGKLWTAFEIDTETITPIQSVTDGYTFSKQSKYPLVDSEILSSLEKEKE